MVLLRYLDVCLVLATAPFAFAGAIPETGYLIGACAWLLTRAASALLTDRALHAAQARARGVLQIAAMTTRLWIVVLAVILARTEGGRDDGIAAAALVLAAFTVYLAISFVTRPGAGGASAHGHGRPSTS